MRRPKLITNYSHLSDGELAVLATRTLDALGENTNFPDLDPPFAEYEPVAQDYLNKQAVTAAGGNLRETKEKDEARTALITMMRRVSTYINNFTDLASVQLSSGFYPVASPSSIRAPRPCEWTRIRASLRPAEILLDFPAIREAYEYEKQIADEVDQNGQPLWQSAGNSSSSRGNFHAPVQDGVTYYFRVRARNKNGVSAWSPVSSMRAMVKE
ncbi:fibronectin type III domain-containing protein [Sinomicrobium weinanense]|uniref:Fibronectin type III domain-containing protein n=1 Tax=Sinomicrobium weinanense TaxID=2842200 RepID=A0A926JPK9_9FLAO|nr:fibronectin type III domain-containing protein [Sinomicrobium weinanense]MBC9795140.1 fibronectin type III domain-containing protein [Sinomicrobium weinanense]MBU3123728.1 fibronectin type III domain-containing protein [Sinomicrobium weinanense]